MYRERSPILKSILVIVCAIVFLPVVQPASAGEFYAYGPYSVPDVNLPVSGIGGYVEDYGVQPTWGDEVQYLYFVDRSFNAYKVRVWMTNHGGVDDPTPYHIDPFQHPNHADPRHQGPIEPRHFEVVVGPVPIREWVMFGRGEFYADETGVYFGPYGGVHKFDHDLNYIGQIAPAFDGMSLGYDPAEKTWYSGAVIKKISRQVYRLRDTDGDGDFMDENWEYIFTHADYGGEFHSGLEYVSGYIWVSDMMSDIIGRYEAADPWPEVETYPYSELADVVQADVVGMGFGPNGNFWVSAADTANYIYEVGTNLYPVARAGVDVLSAPPEVEICFNARQSYHPDAPFHVIKEYEWDFDIDDNPGVYDISYTDGNADVCHAYPAYRTDDTDPLSIDWEATAKCYTAKLRVTDDILNFDIDTRIICITPPPWDPVADAGDSYNTRVNEELCLDGSASFDPADLGMYPPDHPWYDEVVLWEWDLDGDGVFGEEGETGTNPCMSWSEEGTYFVTIRVTDAHGATDEDTAVVVVQAIHDVAVAGVKPAQDTDIHECDVIPIDVKISNIGDYVETNFSVKVYCDSDQIGEFIVESLAPGETQILTVLWDTTGVPAGMHKISADADVVPGEILVANNSRVTVVVVDHMRWLTISSGDNGSVIEPGEGQFLYDDGTDVPVEAAPDEHYHFLEWTGTAVDAGKVTPVDSAIATVTVEQICNLTLNANFAIDTHTLTTSSTFGGSVTTPGEGTFEYNYGQIVELAATAEEPGHHFSRWIGPMSDESLKLEQTTVEITGDTEVKAVFALEVTQEDTVDSSDGQENTYFLPPEFEDEDDIWSPEGMKYYRNHFGDWSWTHIFASEPDPMPSAVNSATLEIEAWDVDSDEFNDIYGDNGDDDGSERVLLGTLAPGDEKWVKTKIDLNADALELLLGGKMRITIDVSAEKSDNENNYSHWRMAVRSSKLTVNYDIETEDD